MSATNRLPRVPDHGASEYSNHGCRCDICVEAHAEAMYEYRVDNQSRIYARQKARRAELRAARAQQAAS